VERHGAGAGGSSPQNLESLMIRIMTRKRATDLETEILRLRFQLEQLQKDALARGLLLNEIYQIINQLKEQK
jgi:hypothetical protein